MGMFGLFVDVVIYAVVLDFVLKKMFSSKNYTSPLDANWSTKSGGLFETWTTAAYSSFVWLLVLAVAWGTARYGLRLVQRFV